MTLSAWMELTSLDPPKLNSKQKAKKLIEALRQERESKLDEIISLCEANASSYILVIKQAGFAKETGDTNVWRSSGPFSNIRHERLLSVCGSLSMTEEVLKTMLDSWPEFQTPPRERASAPGTRTRASRRIAVSKKTRT